MKAIKHLIQEEKDKKSFDAKPVKAVRAKKYIEPIIANFRRTKKGRALVEQEFRSLLEFESKNFPLKSMLTPDGAQVRFSEKGSVKSVSVEELMGKVFDFFSYYFFDVRNKTAFGVKVQGWLNDAAGHLNGL